MISERTEKTLEVCMVTHKCFSGYQCMNLSSEYSYLSLLPKIAKLKSTEVLQKMATSAGKAKTKAMENPAMSSAATAVNQGIQTSW